MIIVDGHLDMAFSALSYGRDLRRSVAEVRAGEPAAGPPEQGVATVTLPALREAGVGLVFGTLFALPRASLLPEEVGIPTYRTQAEAHALAQQQLDYYHRLADEEKDVRLVGDAAGLAAVLASHQGEESERLLGIVPLMEGAEPISEPAELEMWYGRGLRMIGPAWDDSRYAPSTKRAGGRFTRDGRRLLEMMAELGIILDISHLAEEATFEAFDSFAGQIVATHSNAQALVPGKRQLSDAQIRGLAERGGVVGVVLYNVFLRAGHQKGSARELVTVDHVAAHIDHICQLVGNARHVGLGSDLDGGFGWADTPLEVESAADLTAVASALRGRGYEEEDIVAIMGMNWVRLLNAAWSGA